jgi:uncharacterized protein (TIGR00303 family)
MRLILAAGTTRTAAIDGISAAGRDPSLLVHTSSADAEILAYGDTVRAPVVPVSPTGCPTPAAVTRAAREVLGFDVTVVDAGLAESTGAPTVSVGARPGQDVREQDPVPSAVGAFEAARQFGRALPEPAVTVGETIPGGTTTALGVLQALGEDLPVSSSLPENPLDLKERVVAEGLDASSFAPGDAAGEPKTAIRRMGDPVLAVVAGVALGAVETDTHVTLGGGTQMVAAAALLRHAGYDGPLAHATTSFIDADPTVDLQGAAAALDLDLTVTDPGFTEDHVAMARYLAGEGKEGVGMGGALAMAAEVGALGEVRDRLGTIYDRLVGDDGP